MNSEEIQCLLKNDKYFKGVYPCDKLPKIKKRPVTLIVNTDPSDKPGEHWVGIYLKKDGYGYYFDSYGLRPLRNEILKYLNDECSNGFKFNPVTLQTPSVTSFTCGHYCVLFCICMSAGISFENFLKLFSSNTLLNDIATQLVVETDESCIVLPKYSIND